MVFKNFLKEYSGNIHIEAEFIDLTYNALNGLGFSADNTIACVSICRDELCQPLAHMVNEKWGYAFILSSLAGMFWAGKTGLLAALSHSPQIDGRERYVFYAMSHVAVDEEGRFGYCKRPGRQDQSPACGALDVLREHLAKGQINQEIDLFDIELSLVKMRLLEEIMPGDTPDLFELAKISQRAIKADLERSIKSLIDTSKSDYALISGIQIHRPETNYILPSTFYAVVNGVKFDL